MISAYGYIRVSGAGQVEGHGLQRQREAIERHAKAHGFQVVEVFSDEGVSGTNDLENRPGLAALMLAVETNGVSTVLVEKLDRLARDLVVQETLIGRMRRNDVTLVSTAEGDDLASADPSRELVRQIMGAVAQYDKTMTVMKLRAAREAKRASGVKCEGRKAYGEVDPKERSAVERIRELRRKRPGRRRLGPARIAKRMQEENYPTRGGGAWTKQTVVAILNGPTYAQLGKRGHKERKVETPVEKCSRRRVGREVKHPW